MGLRKIRRIAVKKRRRQAKRQADAQKRDQNDNHDENEVDVLGEIADYEAKRDAAHNEWLERELRAQLLWKVARDKEEAREDEIKKGKSDQSGNVVREICQFFSKTGCCRFGDRCKFLHEESTSGCIVLLVNMFHHVVVKAVKRNVESDRGLNARCIHLASNPPLADTQGVIADPLGLQTDYAEFFNDLLAHLQPAGALKYIVTCSNLEMHLAGNVYVEFCSEAEAEAAVNLMNGRYVAERQIVARRVKIDDWSAAICGEFHRKRQCRKGVTACNYIHMLRNPGDRLTLMLDELRLGPRRSRWGIGPEGEGGADEAGEEGNTEGRVNVKDRLGVRSDVDIESLRQAADQISGYSRNNRAREESDEDEEGDERHRSSRRRRSSRDDDSRSGRRREDDRRGYDRDYRRGGDSDRRARDDYRRSDGRYDDRRRDDYGRHERRRTDDYYEQRDYRRRDDYYYDERRRSGYKDRRERYDDRRYDDRPDEDRAREDHHRYEARRYDDIPDEDRAREGRHRNDDRRYDDRPDEERARGERNKNDESLYNDRPGEKRSREERTRIDESRYDDIPDEDRARGERHKNDDSRYDERPDEDRPREERHKNDDRRYDDRPDEDRPREERHKNDDRRYDDRPDEDRARGDHYRNDDDRYNGRGTEVRRRANDRAAADDDRSFDERPHSRAKDSLMREISEEAPEKGAESLIRIKRERKTSGYEEEAPNREHNEEKVKKHKKKKKKHKHRNDSRDRSQDRSLDRSRDQSIDAKDAHSPRDKRHEQDEEERSRRDDSYYSDGNSRPDGRVYRDEQVKTAKRSDQNVPFYSDKVSSRDDRRETGEAMDKEQHARRLNEHIYEDERDSHMRGEHGRGDDRSQRHESNEQYAPIENKQHRPDKVNHDHSSQKQENGRQMHKQRQTDEWREGSYDDELDRAYESRETHDDRLSADARRKALQDERRQRALERVQQLRHTEAQKGGQPALETARQRLNEEDQHRSNVITDGPAHSHSSTRSGQQAEPNESPGYDPDPDNRPESPDIPLAPIKPTTKPAAPASVDGVGIYNRMMAKAAESRKIFLVVNQPKPKPKLVTVADTFDDDYDDNDDDVYKPRSSATAPQRQPSPGGASQHDETNSKRKRKKSKSEHKKKKRRRSSNERSTSPASLNRSSKRSDDSDDSANASERKPAGKPPLVNFSAFTSRLAEIRKEAVIKRTGSSDFFRDDQ